MEVRFEIYTTNAAPAKPLEILSAIITPIKYLISVLTDASHANRILLKAAIIAPINSALIVPISKTDDILLKTHLL